MELCVWRGLKRGDPTIWANQVRVQPVSHCQVEETLEPARAADAVVDAVAGDEPGVAVVEAVVEGGLQDEEDI